MSDRVGDGRDADRRAYVVVDLGFGDAGKGVCTDFLVRNHSAGTVVRFNGGAQAGHNVVTADGRHHTFSQFGAGSFVEGVRTFLSRHVVVHPTALLVEADRLHDAGVRDALERIEIADEALVVTPMHQAANRIREHARGDHRHGSCGVGVGETVKDALADATNAILTKHLRDEPRLRRAMRTLQARKRAELAAEIGPPSSWPEEERAVLEGASISDIWIEILGKFPREIIVEEREALGRVFADRRAVVFEGAQGVLLDEWRGFHPHTTWSTTTFDDALELLRGSDRAVVKLGVLRTYATRHGEGPFPTEDASLDALDEPHNDAHGQQGKFRRGWFDAVLARYAVECCGGIDALALTHVDALAKMDRFRLAARYEGLDRLPLAPKGELSTALTALVRRAKPVYESPADPISAIEESIGKTSSILVAGPTAAHARTTRPL